MIAVGAYSKGEAYCKFFSSSVGAHSRLFRGGVANSRTYGSCYLRI